MGDDCRAGLGIDVGGTTAKLGIVDAAGAIRSRTSVPTGYELSAEALVDRLAGAARPLLAQAREAGLAVVAEADELPVKHHLAFGQLVGEALQLGEPLGEVGAAARAHAQHAVVDAHEAPGAVELDLDGMARRLGDRPGPGEHRRDERR